MPECSTDNIQMFSDSDREHFDEEIWNKEIYNEENFDEEN